MTGDGLPVQDLEWRYGVYRLANPDCELLRYFPTWDRGYHTVDLGGTKMHIKSPDDGVNIHHGWAGRSGRFDRPWNVVNVGYYVHLWVEKFKTDGRVLVIRRKLDSGLWDEQNAIACLGFSPLGWVQGVVCEHAWAEKIRRTVVRDISRGAA